MDKFSILVDQAFLSGTYEHVAGRSPLVILVQGGSTSRADARQRMVASRLREAGLSTLALDLLDAQESRNRRNVTDAELQAERLLRVSAQDAHSSIGYYATGSGVSATLLAAAADPGQASALVLIDGNPDAATFWLPRIVAPTLVIAHGDEAACGDRLRSIYGCLAGPTQIRMVPQTGDAVVDAQAELASLDAARHWLSRHLDEGTSAAVTRFRSRPPASLRPS
jgi:hypothetical protein